jgi:ABC-type antimicrobial peptide transport system permease subunit
LGITPTLPDAIDGELIDISRKPYVVNHLPEDNFIFDKGGQSMGEFLYSPSGA